MLNDLDYVRERERKAMEALRHVSDLATYTPGLRKLESRAPIVEAMAAKARSVIHFLDAGVFLFDEGRQDLVLAHTAPDGDGIELDCEVEALIESGSVAAALMGGQPVFATSLNCGCTLVLHAIATPSRVRGLFVGALAEERSSLSDIQLPLLTLVLQQGAQMLESFELYSLHRDANRKLSENVKTLHRTRAELDEAKNQLEMKVDLRTRELERANLELETEIRRREDVQTSLDHRDATLRALFNATDNFILMVDENGSVLDCNEALAAAFGKSVDELRGRGPEDLMSPGNAAAIQSSLRKALRIDRPVYHHQVHEGRLYSVKLYPARFRDSSRFVAMFGQDVTERHRAQKALHESEVRYRSLFEDSPIALWEQDASRLKRLFDKLRDQGVGDFRAHFRNSPDEVAECIPLLGVSDVNKAALRLYGARDKRELIQNIGNVLTGESLPLLGDLLAALAHGSIEFQGESRHMTLDGSVIEVMMRMSVPPGFEHSLGKVILSLEDVTMRNRMQRELVQAKEAAEAGARAKSVFLSNMSHELRTPLNAALGMTQMLLDTAGDAQQREFLEGVYDSSRQMLRIVNDLLDLSSVESGAFSLNEEAFELRSSLGTVRDIYESQARAKGMDFTLEVAGDVPDRLVGDVRRFKQVLVNLLGNAMKFTDHGEVRAEVEFMPEKGAPRDAWLLCTVRDTGEGIPPERLETIFDSFTLGEDYLTKRHGGAGIGLATAKAIVRRMGGDISVESEQGNGSVFRFRVRFGLPENANGSEQERSAKEGGLHVLVAQDDAEATLAVGRLIRSMGHAIDVAVDAEQAMAMLAGGGFDLFVTDMHLNGAGGLDLVRRIRRGEVEGVSDHLGIIVVSPFVLDSEACYEAGADECLSTPHDEEGFRRGLEKAARRLQTG